MDTETSQYSHDNADHEKKWVALTSVIAAIFLTSMKLVVGLLTGSLGILSEAAHSGLDLIAALVTYFAVRISGRPADARYTYGYGKVENLSALFETVLLMVTCIWIIYEAIQRLFFKSVEVEASIWAFVIMAVSIGVDIGRSRALARAAKKYDSQALEADALHFSTDIWSSSVVIGGLFLVVLSGWLNLPWLAKADAVAALGVAGIVVFVSMQLGKKTVTALLDAVPAGLTDEVSRAVWQPGVQAVKQVRLRRSGPESFADITLTVSQDTTFEQAQTIASQAEAAVQKIMPGADVLVYVQPGIAEEKGIQTAVRRIASQAGVHIHSIRIYENGSVNRTLDLHMEVSELMDLEEAHEMATRLETSLRNAPLQLENIIVHLEPFGEKTTHRESRMADELMILHALNDLQQETGVPCQAHDILVQRTASGLSVSFHCLFDKDLSISEVHRQTERIERSLQSRLPDLERVVIHTEPITEQT